MTPACRGHSAEYQAHAIAAKRERQALIAQAPEADAEAEIG